MLNNSQLKAKCAVLERRAPETEIQAHAYRHGIDFQKIQENVMHSKHVVIIEKRTNTIICYHYFDMLEYNNIMMMKFSLILHLESLALEQSEIQYRLMLF